MLEKESLSAAEISSFADDEIIELSLADLEMVGGGLTTKCGSSGTCDMQQQQQ
ncbi:hypothetical protein LQR31_02625 [Chromobacterium vaccinii]|uniref:hypothetical protein n=1 Tax=Chromobacterium TaxID=535 RepID=UPI001C8C5D61|nr:MULTISPECIES: hypothetical protein [Chromobacterium]MBX9268994.1 hypothetical protein [Chromobacterium violaceum]MCD4483365.1 hypothetical protein [Chromobacterium vaccinii]